MTALYYGDKDLDRAVAAIGQHDDLAVLSTAQKRVLAAAVFGSADLTPAQDRDMFWYVLDRERAIYAMRDEWLRRAAAEVSCGEWVHCAALLDAAIASDAIGVPGGSTSDGFHTFDELYRFRMLYNAALFSAWHRLDGEGIGDDVEVHKSRRHHDGAEPFDDPDWFIVVAQLPAGQISNHYRIADAWDLFEIPERATAAEWDGHTAADVEARLLEFLVGR